MDVICKFIMASSQLLNVLWHFTDTETSDWKTAWERDSEHLLWEKKSWDLVEVRYKLAMGLLWLQLGLCLAPHRLGVLSLL